MLEYVRKSGAKCFIVATEVGILHTLRKQSPEKLFIAASQRAVCPNMKKINLEKIAWSLEDMRYRITVDKDIADGAKAALDRMLEILPGK
jgi:quinolinate synthase